MPAAHCVSSLDGIILNADQGFLQLLQRNADDVIGVSYKDITDIRDLGRSADMLALLVEGAAPVRLQKRYLRADGSSIVANLFVTRFSNPDRLISTLFWQESGRMLPPAQLSETALRLRELYSVLARLFGKQLGPDVMGIILIEAYLAEAEGRIVTLKEVAVLAQASLVTTFRWIAALRQELVLEGRPGVETGLQLTKSGVDRVEAMLMPAYGSNNCAIII